MAGSSPMSVSGDESSSTINESSVNSDHAFEGVLLYVGPATDVRPLVYPYAFVPHVRDYVYVDGMPNSRYYPRYSSKAALLGKFERRWALFAFATFTSEQELVEDKYILYNTHDGRRVHYFINTLNSEIVGSATLPQLAELVECTTHLYMSGTPKKKILELMPTIEHVFSTCICARHLQDAQISLWTEISDYDFDESGDGWIEMCSNC